MTTFSAKEIKPLLAKEDIEILDLYTLAFNF